MSNCDRGHSHGPPNFNRAFAIGIVLNLAFVVIEAFCGWKINSLSLLADAGHNLSDVAGLVLAWGGVLAGRLRPDSRHTYGWKRGSIMAAFANSLLLLMAMGALIWEAIGRLGSVNSLVAVEGITVMLVAGIGILVNTSTALLFMRIGKQDLNIRSALVHMVADTLVSAGVVVVGAVSLWVGWTWLDPVVSLIIGAVILIGTLSMFKQSLHLLFDGVPETIDLQKVHDLLLSLPDVTQVADLHVWAIGTSQIAMTAHLVMPTAYPNDAFFHDATNQLHQHFEITHITLQVINSPILENCMRRVTAFELENDKSSLTNNLRHEFCQNRR